MQVLQETCKIKNYRRLTVSPLSDSALGKTLQQISDLRREVCVQVGADDGDQQLTALWEAHWDQGSSYVVISGQRYGDLSALCSNLLERLERLEVQLVRNGVSGRKP